MKYLALTLVTLASCGLDLQRREGSLAVIPLGTPVPDGTTVVVSLDSDGNKADANGAASLINDHDDTDESIVWNRSDRRCRFDTGISIA